MDLQQLSSLDLATLSVEQMESLYQQLTEVEKQIDGLRGRLLARLVEKRLEMGQANGQIAIQGLDKRGEVGQM